MNTFQSCFYLTGLHCCAFNISLTSGNEASHTFLSWRRVKITGWEWESLHLHPEFPKANSMQDTERSRFAPPCGFVLHPVLFPTPERQQWSVRLTSRALPVITSPAGTNCFFQTPVASLAPPNGEWEHCPFVAVINLWQGTTPGDRYNERFPHWQNKRLEVGVWNCPMWVLLKWKGD